MPGRDWCYWFVFYLGSGLADSAAWIAGILIVLTYTLWLNRHPLLCLLAPGLIGPVMVLTTVVLGAGYGLENFVISLVPFSGKQSAAAKPVPRC